MSSQPLFPAFDDATSSGESADGSTPLNSPDGETNQCGPDHARASRSAARANRKPKQTSDTFGQSFIDLSPSAGLQRSLESRLLASLDVNGSPEYVMTWKHWAMKSGPPICALRASERPTEGSGFTGWPTPTSPVNTDGHQAGNNRYVTKCVTVLKGWPTPVAQQANGTPERFLERKKESVARTGRSMGIVLSDLQMVAQHTLKGWATPRARDHKNNGVSIARAAKGVADSLDLQCKLVCLNGTAPQSPLDARMDRGAYPLNPTHSLWLMGFPAEWANFAGPAMQ
jgi:hypothetical protein